MKNAFVAAAILCCTQVSASVNPLVKQQVTIFKILNANPTFSFLRGNKTPNGYHLQWRLAATGGVQRFIIESTYEDPGDQYSVWQIKGMVNLTNGVNKFSDSNMLPGIINYRITALGKDNIPLAVSDIFTITIQ